MLPRTKCLALIAAVLLTAPMALGELAPEVYEQMQREAPELLQVQVVSVDIDREFRKPEGCGALDFETVRQVEVKAKVLSVVRSATAVKPGQVIKINYTSLKPCEGWSGPRPIPVLSKKDKVYAYLAKGDGNFAPAARGASFSGAKPAAK